MIFLGARHWCRAVGINGCCEVEAAESGYADYRVRPFCYLHMPADGVYPVRMIEWVITGENVTVSFARSLFLGSSHLSVSQSFSYFTVHAFETVSERGY